MNICSAPFAPSYWIPHLLANIPGICTDTFDRANTVNSLGTADSGQVWSSGTLFAIDSNFAKPLGSANAIATLECYNQDATVSVVMTVNSGTAGLILRSSGSGHLRLVFESGNVNLYSVVGGATLIGTAVHSANNGDELKAVCVGTSVDVYVNNSFKFNATVTFNQNTGTKFGLFADLNTAARYNNLNIVTPVPVDVTDNFNRPDNALTLGTASDGVHSWTIYGGTWGIATNTARQQSGVFSIVTVTSNRSDCTIQVSLPVNSTNGAGLAFRVLDGANFIRAAWNGGSLLLIKRVAGVDTTITSTVFANTNGQVLRVVLLGSSISVFVGGVLKLTGTDSFNILATRHGLFSGSAPVIRYDDFSIVA